MAKATLTLQNGTSIVVEGTVEEIQRLIEFYGEQPSSQHKQTDRKLSEPPQGSSPVKKDKPEDGSLTEIVNITKSGEQAEAIEKYILDKANEANRVLLPLFIVYEHFDNAFGLTTVEISKITIDLGVKVSRQNCLRALKYTAKAYVIKTGKPPRYSLNRRGIAFMRSTISGGEEVDSKSTQKTYMPKKKKGKNSKKGSISSKGPASLILELINDGFFEKRKSLSDIQKKLEELGHIFAQTSLSAPVLRLVREKKLNRSKEEDVWLYATK